MAIGGHNCHRCLGGTVENFLPFADEGVHVGLIAVNHQINPLDFFFIFFYKIRTEYVAFLCTFLAPLQDPLPNAKGGICSMHEVYAQRMGDVQAPTLPAPACRPNFYIDRRW